MSWERNRKMMNSENQNNTWSDLQRAILQVNEMRSHDLIKPKTSYSTVGCPIIAARQSHVSGRHVSAKIRRDLLMHLVDKFAMTDTLAGKPLSMRQTQSDSIECLGENTAKRSMKYVDMIIRTQAPSIHNVPLGGNAMNETEAAKFLCCTPSALRKWRALEKGPAYVRVERLVRYLPEDLRAYMDANRVESRDARAGEV